MRRSRNRGGHGTLAYPQETYFPYDGNLIHHGRPFERNAPGYRGGMGMPYRGSDYNTRDEYHGYGDEGRNSRRMEGVNYLDEREGYENFGYMEPGYGDYNARGASQEGYGRYWKEHFTGPSPMDLKHGYTGPRYRTPSHHRLHPRNLRPMPHFENRYGNYPPYRAEMPYPRYAPEEHGYDDEFGRGAWNMHQDPYMPMQPGRYRGRRLY